MVTDAPQKPAIDAAQLTRLLAMVGPGVAPGLLGLLHADLCTARQGLMLATRRQDWAQIRAQSHIVMGLAGTMGATALQGLAKRLMDKMRSDPPNRPFLLALISVMVAALDATLAELSKAVPDLDRPA